MKSSVVSTSIKATALLALAISGNLYGQIDYGAYNMIVKNDLVLNGGGNVHMNSATLVGGNLKLKAGLTNYEFGVGQRDNTYSASNTNLSLSVLGSVQGTGTGSGITKMAMSNNDAYLANNYLDKGSYPYYLHTTSSASSATTTIAVDNSDTVSSTSPFNVPVDQLMSTVFTRFGTLSNQLKSATAAGATLASVSGATFSTGTAATSYLTLTGAESGIFTTSVVNGQTVYTFGQAGQYWGFNNLSNSRKLVINLNLAAGSVLNFNLDYGTQQEAMGGQLLWNITGANTVNFNNNTSAFYGSFLATGADLRYQENRNTYGQIVANSFTFEGPEVGAAEFYSQNGFFFSTDTMPPIPEPSTYALMGAASCGALALLRRRRARKAA